MTPTSEAVATGIFGGTFDPIHRGHLAVALQAADRLGLREVLLVPAGQPPHRPPPEATAADRLAMARVAAAGYPRLTVSDIEVRRPGPSYAIDTIRELRATHPDRTWTLLLGWDAAREFGGWHEAAEIVSLADIAVFNRSGEEAPDREVLAAVGLPPATRLLPIDSPLLSADEIRARLRDGADVSGMLHPGVVDYIEAHGLYRG